jgi:predicted permease
MKILDKENFLNLQLCFSIFNSLIIIICGLIISRYGLYRNNIGRYNFGGIYALTPLLMFHFINHLLKRTALRKKYKVKE